jgi:hypothetical protein
MYRLDWRSSVGASCSVSSALSQLGKSLVTGARLPCRLHCRSTPILERIFTSPDPSCPSCPPVGGDFVFNSDDSRPQPLTSTCVLQILDLYRCLTWYSDSFYTVQEIVVNGEFCKQIESMAAYPQQIVTTRLLYCLQDRIEQLSRMQRIYPHAL